MGLKNHHGNRVDSLIRPATLSDIYAIEGIAAIEALRYPELKIDPVKVCHLITTSISSAQHFCWVSVNENNEVYGALVGVTSENMWAQRKNCIVALWTSKIVGDGIRLMREFLKWIDTRRIIRIAGIVPDNNEVDPRAWKLAERLGFCKHGGAYLLYN